MNNHNVVAHAVMAKKDECRVERINPHTKRNKLIFITISPVYANRLAQFSCDER